MNASTRRKLRTAERDGIVCRVGCQDDPVMLDRFLAAFDRMAKERGLTRIVPETLAAQFRAGHARLAVAFDPTQASASFVVTYETDGIALYNHGVSDGPDNPLTGSSVHWELMRQLKADGLMWYDLCGLPTRDPANGLTRFKIGFGGEVIHLGEEYRRTGVAANLARRSARPRCSGSAGCCCARIGAN
jgi:Acetyltransferase (GNAT) domain